jgi:phage shock protein A
MNLLERVLTLLRANLNTVIEKADDPEKALRQLQLDMRNQLVQVKTQVATAIAEGHKLRKRSEERKVEADLWMKKAEQAIQQGNDDAARVALVRYNDFTKQVQRYQQQQKDQEHLVRTMRTALRQLEVKISEVETTLDLLATRKRNALLQQRVFDALNKTGGLQEKERTTKAQDAVLEAEAQARALADLQQRDLDTQLDQLSTEKSLEEQLNMLKAKKRPLLQESNGQEAGLLRPQPRSHQPVRRRESETQKQLHSVSEPSTQKDVDIEQLKHLLDMPESSS